MSLTARWNRMRGEFALQDFLLDVAGKVLLALGLGALWASALRPSAWWLVGVGLACSALVKAKYWKRFWS